MLFRLREQHPQIQVILAYPFEGFTKAWTASQRETYADTPPSTARPSAWLRMAAARLILSETDM